MDADQRPTVLVVDDDPVCQTVAVETLLALGFAAHTVRADQFLAAACRQWKPAAVLMDVEMQGTDGRDLTRQLRALQRAGRLAHFAILGTTALDGPREIDACFRAGMDGCIGKPIEIVRLASELSRITGSATLDSAFPIGRISSDDEI